MLPGQMANAFTAEPIPFTVARVVPAAAAPAPSVAAATPAAPQAAPVAASQPMVDKSLEINPR